MNEIAIGDHVICRSGGVWRIESANQDTYTLREHESGLIKSIAAGDREIVRPLISKEAMLEVISRVAFIQTIKAPNDKLRLAFYREALATFDEIEWFRIIKSVYLRQQDKSLLPEELDYGDRAKNYLYAEISVLLQIPMAEIEDYITASVDNDDW